MCCSASRFLRFVLQGKYRTTLSSSRLSVKSEAIQSHQLRYQIILAGQRVSRSRPSRLSESPVVETTPWRDKSFESQARGFEISELPDINFARDDDVVHSASPRPDAAVVPVLLRGSAPIGADEYPLDPEAEPSLIGQSRSIIADFKAAVTGSYSSMSTTPSSAFPACIASSMTTTRTGTVCLERLGRSDATPQPLLARHHRRSVHGPSEANNVAATESPAPRLHRRNLPKAAPQGGLLHLAAQAAACSLCNPELPRGLPCRPAAASQPFAILLALARRGRKRAIRPADHAGSRLCGAGTAGACGAHGPQECEKMPFPHAQRHPSADEHPHGAADRKERGLSGAGVRVADPVRHDVGEAWANATCRCRPRRWPRSR